MCSPLTLASARTFCDEIRRHRNADLDLGSLMSLMWWSLAEFYREKGDECREWALMVSDPERRQQYLELASMWDTLVVEATRRHFSERETSQS
jgi:hypothetical protein